jgi:hypothetical protein
LKSPSLTPTILAEDFSRFLQDLEEIYGKVRQIRKKCSLAFGLMMISTEPPELNFVNFLRKEIVNTPTHDVGMLFLGKH